VTEDEDPFALARLRDTQDRGGPVAVVTGAGSGIGRAVAAGLLAAGHRVALAGRRQAALRETVAGVADPPGALVVPADVADPAAVRALFGQVLDAWGRVDLLFNNAGTFGATAPVDELDVAAWRAVLDTNLTGSFLCAQEAIRAMKRQRPQGGRIINNGSISAHVPRPHAVAYTATKHAITGLTKTIALEGRPFAIACGQIDIGNAATELSASIGAGTLQADGSTRREPMMDLGHAAAAVLHMASLPLDANVQFMTVMATSMPYIGRG
jgi:NAD(P)-dependent dehydrogenase (short-subunit alcohol dehydrogenase family)